MKKVLKKLYILKFLCLFFNWLIQDCFKHECEYCEAISVYFSTSLNQRPQFSEAATGGFAASISFQPLPSEKLVLSLLNSPSPSLE